MTIGATSASSVASGIEKAIGSAQSSLSLLEQQVSTGLAISAPSQNPSQALQILDFESQLARAKQYTANAQDGTNRLAAATSAVNSVLTVLYQAQSALGSISSVTQDIPGAVKAITEARSQLLVLANTQYAGQAIFSGTGTPSHAYSATGAYLGGSTVPTRRVASETTVAIGTTGPAVFGPTGTTGKTGLLGNTGILATIKAQLNSGTPTKISKALATGMASLQAAITRALSQETELGASKDAMQQYATQAKEVVGSLTGQLSSARDVTMAEAITNLQTQQTAYQAALYTASAIKTDGLVQYL